MHVNTTFVTHVKFQPSRRVDLRLPHLYPVARIKNWSKGVNALEIVNFPYFPSFLWTLSFSIRRPCLLSSSSPFTHSTLLRLIPFDNGSHFVGHRCPPPSAHCFLKVHHSSDTPGQRQVPWQIS